MHFDNDSLAQSLDLWTYKFKGKQRENGKKCLALKMCFIYLLNGFVIIALP